MAFLEVWTQPLPLVLMRPFGTSHSRSTTRTNALITVTFLSETGHGEAGLPPKKEGVYLADYGDTELGVAAWVEHLRGEVGHAVGGADGGIADGERHGARRVLVDPRGAWAAVRRWVSEGVARPEWRPAASAVEMALVDLIGKLEGLPAHAVLGLDHPCLKARGPQRGLFETKRGFVTVGIERDEAELVAAIEDALGYTDFLKLKADGGPDALSYISGAIERCVAAKKRRSPAAPLAGTIAVDANGAWTPALALEFLAARPGGEVVYMVEQPFGVDVEPGTDAWAQWEEVRRRYTEGGLLIYADESVATAEDVTRLQPLCHGVNIKLDKAGGFSAAIRAVDAAGTAGMCVWFGCMISSSLACTAAAHLLRLATYGGDLDGGILTTKESQPLAGGMLWTRATDGLSCVDIECCGHEEPQHKSSTPPNQGGIMSTIPAKPQI